MSCSSLRGNTIERHLPRSASGKQVRHVTSHVITANSKNNLVFGPWILEMRNPRAVCRAGEVEFAHELPHAVNDFVGAKRYRIACVSFRRDVINDVFIFASGKMRFVHTKRCPSPRPDDVRALRLRPERQT